MAGDADHVLIDGRRLRDPLSFERAFNLENPIPQPGRFLEVFTLRGGFHLRAQVVQELPVVPFQKLAHLPNDAVVILLRLIACAGRHAAFDFEFDARPFGRAVDVDRAGGQWKHLFDDFQRFPEGAGRRVGAIVECAVFLHAANDREPGKVVFDRQAKIGILLVVPSTTLKRGRCRLTRLLSRIRASNSERVTIVSRSAMWLTSKVVLGE